MTFVACGSAAGAVIPPGIIYSGQRVAQECKEGGPLGAKYYATESAYMNEEKMLLWLEHFNRHAILFVMGFLLTSYDILYHVTLVLDFVRVSYAADTTQ